jgi:Spy/CpxP family protein refolding chaperone
MKLSPKSVLAALALGLAFVPMISNAEEATPPAGRPPGGGGGGGGGRGMQTPEQQVTALETAVGTLTADQKTKITAIFTKTAADMQAIPQEDRRTKGRELRTAANKEVRALLTPEQQTKFDAIPQRGPGGGGRPAGGDKPEKKE